MSSGSDSAACRQQLAEAQPEEERGDATIHSTIVLMPFENCGIPRAVAVDAPDLLLFQCLRNSRLMILARPPMDGMVSSRVLLDVFVSRDAFGRYLGPAPPPAPVPEQPPAFLCCFAAELMPSLTP